jgi:ABC-type Fe3+-siderophore transport system permease subunit
MQVLGRLAPQLISIAAPQALRKAVCGHFAQALATSALVGASLVPAAEYAVPSGHLLAPPFSPSEIHEMLHVMQPQRR